VRTRVASHKRSGNQRSRANLARARACCEPEETREPRRPCEPRARGDVASQVLGGNQDSGANPARALRAKRGAGTTEVARTSRARARLVGWLVVYVGMVGNRDALALLSVRFGPA
jgi:hypothetical protein